MTYHLRTCHISAEVALSQVLIMHLDPCLKNHHSPAIKAE